MKDTGNDKQPQFVKREGFKATDGYIQWLRDLKGRLRQSQVKAAMSVNTVLLDFYWTLGRDIERMQPERIWGAGFYARLSLDLREAFPDMKGFSVTNLKYIRRWYVFYNEDCINRQQLVDDLPEALKQVPWGHHIEIITHSKTQAEAQFYLQKVAQGNWSRLQLMRELESNLYERQGSALTNFDSRLPQIQGGLAQELLKDPYNFDFLSLAKDYDERAMEDALEHNIRRFLLELGQGFAYVGRQMELRMPNGKSYFPDMVFYHTKLKCYVVLELKVVDFEPEFAGKLNFYVSAADHLLKDETDNPSIGLLVCKSKDETVVKWAFQGIDRPLGVATYNIDEIPCPTVAERLPSIQEIENAIQTN